MGKVDFEKIKRLCSVMEEQGIDQTFITDSASVYYFTGLHTSSSERCNGIYVHKSGKVTALFNALLETFFLEGAETVLYHDTEEPLEKLRKLAIPGTFGADRHWPCDFAMRFQSMCPELKVVPDTSAERVRMVKTSREMELMRISSKVNDAAMAMTLDEIKEGMTEKDVAEIVKNNYKKQPCECVGGFYLVQFGKNCADPHHDAGDTVIKKGGAVLLDIGTSVSGYWCDMTRTVFMGAPTAFQKEIYAIVKEANLAGIAACRLGAPAAGADKAARDVIEKAGYLKYYNHRTGHNIGTSGHEWPDISIKNSEPLVPGMCFSIEPGIYIPGEIGIRIEDVVMMTENGAEVLNKAPKELRIL